MKKIICFEDIFIFFLIAIFFLLPNRKCGSPKKQNLSAIGRVLSASTPATASSSEKSQHLVVPSRSYAFEVTGDIICPGFVQGIDHLRDPRLNKVHTKHISIYFFSRRILFLNQFNLKF